MKISTNYNAIQIAKPMNAKSSATNFKGKTQMVKANVKQGMRDVFRSDAFRLWAATTSFLSFILFLCAEFCSIGYTGKTLGQHAVEEARQKIEDYRFEHGDIGTKTEIIIKKMQRMSNSDGMGDVLNELNEKTYKWQ